MTALTPLLAVASALAAAADVESVDLATRYVAESRLAIRRESRLEVETTDFRLERDGEPMDRPGGGDRARGSRVERKVAHVDHIVTVEDGQPTEIERRFDDVSGEAERFGESLSLETPFDGSTLLLRRAPSGEVRAELADGETVDEDERLDGHRLTLALDELLPEGPVEPGASWSIASEAWLAALGVDVDPKLFRAPEFEPRGGPGGSGGPRGGGSGPGGGRRGGTERLFQDAEWSVTLTLDEVADELDGQACHTIEIEAKGSGELEERRGGPGGQGGRPRLPADRVGALPRPAATEFEIELEGTLYLSIDLARPVRLDVDGDVEIESDNEFERFGSTVRMTRSQRGTFELTVTVADAEESSE